MKIAILSILLSSTCICNIIPTCDYYKCGEIPPHTPQRANSRMLQAPKRCSSHTKTENRSIFTFSECPKEEICSLSLTDSPSFCFPSWYVNPHNLLPGDKCSEDTDCLGGKCENNTISRCKGLVLGESCSSDSQCGLGLYCYHVCTQLVDLLLPCNITVKCKGYLVCSQGVCVNIGALGEGENTMAPLACKSYYTLKQANNTYICAQGPKLILGTADSSLCPQNGDCLYEDKNGDRSTRICECGITEDGKSFCPLDKGNLQPEIDTYFEWLNTQPNCHISYRPKGLCLPDDSSSDNKKYWKAVVAHYKIMHGYKYLDNPDCIKNMINKDYYTAVENAQPEPPPPPPPHDGVVANNIPGSLLIAILIMAFYA